MQFNIFKNLLFSAIGIHGVSKLHCQILSFRFGLLVANSGSRISIEEEHIVDIVWGVLKVPENNLDRTGVAPRILTDLCAQGMLLVHRC